MNKSIYSLIAAAVMAGAVSANATAQVSVSTPWIRATVPVQKSSGAFMVLTSKQTARLVAVTSPVASAVEMHQSQIRSETQGDLMKMAEVDGIDLPAGKSVNLATGGYHLMLIGLKQQLKEGSTVPLTLVIQGEGGKGKRTQVTVAVPVKALSYAPAHTPEH
jgi:copper(I)-binding protein